MEEENTQTEEEKSETGTRNWDDPMESK